MNINAHLIDPNWEQQSVTLCGKEVEERHTAENLADCHVNVSSEWNIDGKTTAIVRDNASNIVAATTSIPKVKGISCAAHTLNLSVKDALKNEVVSSLLQKCGDIVTFF